MVRLSITDESLCHQSAIKKSRKSLQYIRLSRESFVGGRSAVGTGRTLSTLSKPKLNNSKAQDAQLGGEQQKKNKSRSNASTNISLTDLIVDR